MPAPRSGSPSSSGCGPRTTPFDHEGRFYKITRGVPAAEADPAPYPAIMNAGASERGRHFAAKALRPRLHGHPHRRPRRMPRACAGLPPARARGIRPRGAGLDARQYRAGRDREGGARLLRYYVHQKGDWEAARNMIETFMLEINARNVSARTDKAAAGGLHPGLGRFPLIGTKEQIVDGLARCRAPGSTACCLPGRASSRACASSAT